MTRMHRRLARIAAASVAALAMLASAACGGAPPATVSQPDGPTIAIGVAADEPGLSRWHDGSYAGFEVDVARYVAKKLGYANKQIVFKQVEPSNRLELLADGTVDMVVAGMPMPGTTSGGVASDARAVYAGPYLTTGQSLLVRPEDAGRLAADASDTDSGGAGDTPVAGTVCTVAGSGAKGMLLAAYPHATVRERDTYPQCVTDLMVGSADAIAGDAVVLAGLARDEGGTLVTRAKAVRYGRTRYGIAVPAGAVTLAGDIADALDDMRADGSYDAALDALAADAGWRPVR